MSTDSSWTSRSILLALLLTSISMRPACPQTTYGAVVGTALDNSGSVVVGAKVTVANQNTGETYSRLTNDVGTYSFPTLIPGVYQIRAEMTGFRPIEIRDIVLQVNQTARFDLNMEIGQVTENVQVVASAPVLAQDTSDVGQVINGRQIVELPLNGRNYMQLASLTNGLLLSNTTES